MFQRFDCVKYVGSALSGKITTSVGYVVSRVQNQPGALVVEFNEDACIVDEKNLRIHIPSAAEKQPEVRRRRRDDED